MTPAKVLTMNTLRTILLTPVLATHVDSAVVDEPPTLSLIFEGLVAEHPISECGNSPHHPEYAMAQASIGLIMGPSDLPAVATQAMEDTADRLNLQVRSGGAFASSVQVMVWVRLGDQFLRRNLVPTQDITTDVWDLQISLPKRRMEVLSLGVELLRDGDFTSSSLWAIDTLDISIQRV
jgi:hypothetical protein